MLDLLSVENKLDGSSNYPLWSYMMNHILVAHGFSKIVEGSEPRPGSRVTSDMDEDSTSITGRRGIPAPPPAPTTDAQQKWDERDAKAHAMIALSLKVALIPHIRSCKSAKEAWDTLANLYQVRNEARVAYLKRQLDHLVMHEGETMDSFITKLKDLREQLISLGEDMTDGSMVTVILNGIPESYQALASTLRLIMQGNPDSFRFDNLVQILLQEEQSRENRSILQQGDQAFMASQKGKGKAVSGAAYKPKTAANQPTVSGEKDENQPKKKGKCHYCRKPGHYIGECRKRIAKEKEKGTKKEANVAQADASSAEKKETANLSIVSHGDEDFDDEYVCIVSCSYNPSMHTTDESCLSVTSQEDWYFDSGASKHITSQRNLFSVFDATSERGTVTCANNSAYAIQGVGKIVLTATHGGSFTLTDVLYVPGIQKNLLSVPAIAMGGLEVTFSGRKCTVHDLSDEGCIVATGTLCRGLYRLDHYRAGVHDACAVITSDQLAIAELWHARMGHLHFRGLQRLQAHSMVEDMPPIQLPSRHVCEGCILGKMHRTPVPKLSTYGAARKLQLVHSDVCGPMRTKSIGGYAYFVTFIDDFTCFSWVYGLRHKSEVEARFKDFILLQENQTQEKVATLRTDRGGEYMSDTFHAFLASKGIAHQCTVPYTPQQNGKAERFNRTVMEMARCMLKGKGLPNKFWMEALQCSNYVLNRCPKKALQKYGRTPFEMWTGRKPSVKGFKVFGCLSYALVPQHQRGKLDDKAVRCIFVGYSSESKGYRLYHPGTQKILTSRDVTFAEEQTFDWSTLRRQPEIYSHDVFELLLPQEGGSVATNTNLPLDVDIVGPVADAIQPQNQLGAAGIQPATNVIDPTGAAHDLVQSQADLPQPSSEHMAVPEVSRRVPRWLLDTLRESHIDVPLPTRTRSRRAHGMSIDYHACEGTYSEDEPTQVDEPVSFEEAAEDPNWMQAMQSEYDSIMKNETWYLTDLPLGKKAIGVKWVYKIKRNADGTVSRYKARLVAKGYAQEKGIDYDETFAPTSRMTTVRCMLALAGQFGWTIHQLDITTAFLNGDIHEEVYVQQPTGFRVRGQEAKVCRLQKALYGLKQSPRAWYEKIDSYLASQGFLKSSAESTLYVKSAEDMFLILVLYVDDMLLTGPQKVHIAAFKAELQHRFEMSDLGPLHYYLGIQFMQTSGGIYLQQSMYIQKLLQKFSFQDCKPVATPVESGVKLSLEDAGELFDATVYKQAVGSLLYLCNTRPDIQYGVSVLSRFMHCPGTKHWQAVKRIFRYLQGTIHLGLFYPRGDASCLQGYCDSDWAGDYDTRVSTSGYCFFLGDACISWLSKKQPTVATSSCEAEYRAAFTATVECVWLRRLYADLGLEQHASTSILTDSMSALAVAKNPVFHARTKHIEVHYHYVRERLAAGEICLSHVSTHDNVADIFTKALPRDKFEAFRQLLNLIPLPGD